MLAVQPFERQVADEVQECAVEAQLAGELQATGQAHAAFYATLAEQSGPALWGPDFTAGLARLQPEQDNLRAAVQWAVQQGDAALAVRLAHALYWLWYLLGGLAEGRDLALDAAIAYTLDSVARAGATERQAARSAASGLTGRELEVVALLAQGKSNRDIAEALVVTDRTVETHISHIRSKLNLTSRAQIAVWAVERGMFARCS